MTAPPILFSAPMLRALLDGRKTQTRRIVKPQPVTGGDPCFGAIWPQKELSWRVGDRLWVREAWRLSLAGGFIVYRADPGREETTDHFSKMDASIKWTSPIHMPRWASRLTLIVTDVRMQRLQEISEADAKAEGLEFRLDWLPQYRGSSNLPWRSEFACDAYADLWNALHGDGAWSVNPWVAAITFTVKRCNIDALANPLRPLETA